MASRRISRRSSRRCERGCPASPSSQSVPLRPLGGFGEWGAWSLPRNNATRLAVSGHERTRPSVTPNADGKFPTRGATRIRQVTARPRRVRSCNLGSTAAASIDGAKLLEELELIEVQVLRDEPV